MCLLLSTTGYRFVEADPGVGCDVDQSKLFVSMVTDVSADAEDEWFLEILISGTGLAEE